MKAIRLISLLTALAVSPLAISGCTVARVERTDGQVEGSWTVVDAYDRALLGAPLELRGDGSFSGERLPAELITGEAGETIDASGTWSLAEPISAGQPWTISLRFDEATASGRGTDALTLEGSESDPRIRWWLDIDAGEFLLLEHDAPTG